MTKFKFNKVPSFVHNSRITFFGEYSIMAARV
jgi:hypothetical protein